MCDIGKTMRQGVDEWHAFCTCGEILEFVEDQLGVSINDADIFEAKPLAPFLTLDSLADLVRRHLPPDDPSREQQARELVLEAASKVAGHNVDLEAFNLPILEAVFPARWEGR